MSTAEFRNLRKALDETGIKDPSAVNRTILPDLPLKEFKETVLGAVFRKVIPRIPYDKGFDKLLYSWYKAGGRDDQFKFNEAVVGQYINETPPPLLSLEPPPKKVIIGYRIFFAPQTTYNNPFILPLGQKMPNNGRRIEHPRVSNFAKWEKNCL